MDASDGLGFGTQLTIDGASSDSQALADPWVTSELLEKLVALAEKNLDSAMPRPLLDVASDGLSAALIIGETSAALHTFPALRTATLQLFTAHDLPLGAATKQFLAAYRVGRFQSSVRGRGLYLPRRGEELRRALAGQRAYARLRVAPPSLVQL